MPAAAPTTHFNLLATGQIESGLFPEYDQLYVKWSLNYGPDWTVISTSPEEGISQQAQKPFPLSPAYTHQATTLGGALNTWNIPLDLAFRSTNFFGWPQLVLSVYGPDFLGRDVVRGYGAVHLPRLPGLHVLYVPMVVPVATSKLNGLLSTLSGRLPEFLDAKFVSKSEGREVTRVRHQGMIKVQVNVLTKDVETFGYLCGSATPVLNPLSIETVNSGGAPMGVVSGATVSGRRLPVL